MFQNPAPKQYVYSVGSFIEIISQTRERERVQELPSRAISSFIFLGQLEVTLNVSLEVIGT